MDGNPRGAHPVRTYPQEVNDIPAIGVRKMNANAFADMIIDNLDEMLTQSARQPLVMGIALPAGLVP